MARHCRSSLRSVPAYMANMTPRDLTCVSSASSRESRLRWFHAKARRREEKHGDSHRRNLLAGVREVMNAGKSGH